MKLSRRTKACLWGLGVGTFFAGIWFRPMFLSSRPKPMLMPEQSRSHVVFSEVMTGMEIFFTTGIAVALIIYYHPSKKED